MHHIQKFDSIYKLYHLNSFFGGAHCWISRLYFLYYTLVSIKRWSLINTWCRPTVNKINAGSLINAGAWHNIHVAIIPPAMAMLKEKSIHCNKQASGCRGGQKDVEECSCNVDKELPVNYEYGNKHDEHAVAVMKDGEIVGDLPYTISRVSWFFPRPGGCINCRVTGKRRHDDGLEVACVYVHFDNYSCSRVWTLIDWGRWWLVMMSKRRSLINARL